MNTLTKMIAVLLASILLISGITAAQDASDEQVQDDKSINAKELDVAREQAEIAAREAKKQAEIAQSPAAANIRQAGLALAKVKSASSVASPVVPSAGYSTISRRRWPFQSSGASPVLVIPSAEIETKDLLTINEDLNVMSRIFESNLRAARIAPTGGGLFLSSHNAFSALLGQGRGVIQSIYLQDYGSLFLIKVDFPLSPAPEKPKEEETDQEQKGDKVWEQMRQQMYEPQHRSKSKADDKARKYDPEKVESLKTTLVESLKHAANIRNLKPEESVILTVTGSGDFPGDPAMIVASKSILVDVDGKSRTIQEPVSVAAGSPTVLVIRAKKADIDSFAQGDLDLDQFRQRVQILSCLYLDGSSQRPDAIGMY